MEGWSGQSWLRLLSLLGRAGLMGWGCPTKPDDEKPTTLGLSASVCERGVEYAPCRSTLALPMGMTKSADCASSLKGKDTPYSSSFSACVCWRLIVGLVGYDDGR